MSHRDRRQHVHQSLAGLWPRREVELALDRLDEEALAAFYGTRPAEVVSTRIRELRRAADDAAHEAATGGAKVLPGPGRRAG